MSHIIPLFNLSCKFFYVNSDTRTISSKVKSRSMSRDRDANHEVSGRDLDRDRDFTQPSRKPCF